MGADNIIVHAIFVPEEIDNITDTYEDYNYKFYKSLEPALKLAVSVGRHLIKLIEE